MEPSVYTECHNVCLWCYCKTNFHANNNHLYHALTAVQTGCCGLLSTCPLYICQTVRSSYGGGPHGSTTVESRSSTTPYSIALSADGCRWLVGCLLTGSHFCGRRRHVVQRTSSGSSVTMDATNRASLALPSPSIPVVSLFPWSKHLLCCLLIVVPRSHRLTWFSASLTQLVLICGLLIFRRTPGC